MKRRTRLAPEFTQRTRVSRAGFVPGESEYEVDTWQVWCRNAETNEERRANVSDIRRVVRRIRRTR